mmetsp:Transcript_132595/g.264628  ORF Transcript_132595/g.264628 Transcript_132595/m.264628 type:complete len:305 (+) Transcript_132595:693-1607(+)
MDTIPAIMPMQPPQTSIFWLMKKRHKLTSIPEVAVAMTVFMAICAAYMPFSEVFISLMEPMFQPIQPTYMRRAPMQTRGTACGSWDPGKFLMRSRPVKSSKYAGRGFASTEDIKAGTALVKQMMPLPPKSTKPAELILVGSASQPLPQVHALGKGKIKDVYSNAQIAGPGKLERSVMPPLAINAATIAFPQENIQCASAGVGCFCPSGSELMKSCPANCHLPLNPLSLKPVLPEGPEYANDQPKIHQPNVAKKMVVRFLKRTLCTLFQCDMPASIIVKPACINMTSTLHKRVNITSKPPTKLSW